ncbi:MAG: hypothetical protein HY719_15965 [Planctomycetes bacterium]|nr:hypothetical protein [Planctomycetota bacterium]
MDLPQTPSEASSFDRFADALTAAVDQDVLPCNASGILAIHAPGVLPPPGDMAEPPRPAAPQPAAAAAPPQLPEAAPQLPPAPPTAAGAPLTPHTPPTLPALPSLDLPPAVAAPASALALPAAVARVAPPAAIPNRRDSDRRANDRRRADRRERRERRSGEERLSGVFGPEHLGGIERRKGGDRRKGLRRKGERRKGDRRKIKPLVIAGVPLRNSVLLASGGVACVALLVFLTVFLLRSNSPPPATQTAAASPAPLEAAPAAGETARAPVSPGEAPGSAPPEAPRRGMSMFERVPDGEKRITSSLEDARRGGAPAKEEEKPPSWSQGGSSGGSVDLEKERERAAADAADAEARAADTPDAPLTVEADPADAGAATGAPDPADAEGAMTDARGPAPTSPPPAGAKSPSKKAEPKKPAAPPGAGPSAGAGSGGKAAGRKTGAPTAGRKDDAGDEEEALVDDGSDDPNIFRHPKPAGKKYTAKEKQERAKKEYAFVWEKYFAPFGGDTRNFKVVESVHYHLYTDAPAGDQFPKYLEFCYEFVRTIYPFEDREEPLLALVFKSHEEYCAFSRAISKMESPEKTAGHACAYYYATYYQSPNSDAVYHEATHQIVHALVGVVLGGSWLQEGMAVYVEHAIYGISPSNGFSARVRSDDFTPLRELIGYPSMIGGPNPSRNYEQSGTIVDFMLNGPWKAKFKAFLKSNQERPLFTPAQQIANLEKVYGCTLAQFETAWKEYLRKPVKPPKPRGP